MLVDHLFEGGSKKSANPRLDRILNMLRARYPQARDDLEALVLSYRQDQSQDRVDISRLDRENDQEEADIQELEREIQRLRGRGMREGLRDPRDNPCWKGYHPVGTKEKGGRTVPNCVPQNEEASPWIKPPTNRFDTKAEAFAYAKEHGGKVYKRAYIDPRTGTKNITFVVKKAPSVSESTEKKYRVTYDIYGSNRDKPLHTHTRTVTASSEQEAFSLLRNLVGGRNYRTEKDQPTQAGERDLDEAGAFSYGARAPKKGSLKHQMAQQSKKYHDQLPVIEPRDQRVGTAKILPKDQTPDPLSEFAPDGSGSGDDGFSEETLKMLAAQWFNGDEDPAAERTLQAAGWEIGQDEGYEDEPGVFVVQTGDVDGDSYISWSANELRAGPAHESHTPESSLGEAGSTVLGMEILTHDDVKRAINRSLKINRSTATDAVETAVEILSARQQSRLAQSVLQDLDMIVRRYHVPISAQCQEKLALHLGEHTQMQSPVMLHLQAQGAALGKLRTREHPAFEMFTESWYRAHGGV